MGKAKPKISRAAITTEIATVIEGIPVPAEPVLGKREEIFCEAYLLNYDPGEAFTRSGLKKPRDLSLKTKNPLILGRALLAYPDIRAYIKERQDALLSQLRVSQERIREEVAAIAFQDPEAFIELKHFEQPGNPQEGEVRAIRLDRGGNTRIISAIHISETKDGDQRINLKFHNKLDALKMLGRDAGMFEDEGKPPPNIHYHVHLGDGS